MTYILLVVFILKKSNIVWFCEQKSHIRVDYAWIMYTLDCIMPYYAEYIPLVVLSLKKKEVTVGVYRSKLGYIRSRLGFS